MAESTIDIDALADLEERVLKAVSVVAQLKEENAALRKKLAAAMDSRTEASEELEALRTERKQVKARIEKLLGQMEQLSAAE